jgi:hypothetical protein
MGGRTADDQHGRLAPAQHSPSGARKRVGGPCCGLVMPRMGWRSGMAVERVLRPSKPRSTPCSPRTGGVDAQRTTPSSRIVMRGSTVSASASKGTNTGQMGSGVGLHGSLRKPVSAFARPCEASPTRSAPGRIGRGGTRGRDAPVRLSAAASGVSSHGGVRSPPCLPRWVTTAVRINPGQPPRGGASLSRRPTGSRSLLGLPTRRERGRPMGATNARARVDQTMAASRRLGTRHLEK